MNLELGCGDYKNPGFKGLDKRPGKHVDIVADLEEGIPLPDNSVDLISASHILEHIHNLMFLMEEIHRVLKPGGQIAICVPHYKSLGAYQDPTHVRFFTEATFHYWDPRMPLYQTYRLSNQFHIQMQEWTPMGNLEVILTAIKGDYTGTTQEEAIRHEGIGKEVSVKTSGKRKKGKTRKGASRKVSKAVKCGKAADKKA